MSTTACSRSALPKPNRTWLRLPDLPQALGGQFAGTHRGALIIAGGSHFPVSKWEGGSKQWVDSVHVLPDIAGKWTTFRLPRAAGYGGSVSHDRGVLLIGGGDADANSSDAIWLRWDGRRLDVTPAPALPGALANCCAASMSGRAYVVGGQRLPSSTEASNAVYSLDLNDNRAQWKPEAPLPGPARILPSVAATADTLYVAGGATLYADEQGKPKRRYLRDAWQWKPVEGWRALPELPELTCAAPAACLENSFWVLGGSDGSLDTREAELRDQHPGFRRSARIFDSNTGTWSEPVTLPFSLVTTTAVLWDGLLVVPGGEDRPAHRSAEVHACRFAEKRG